MTDTATHERSSPADHELVDPLFAEVVGSPFEWVRDHLVETAGWFGQVAEYCRRANSTIERWFVVHGEHFFPCREDASVCTPEMAVQRMLALQRA